MHSPPRSPRSRSVDETIAAILDTVGALIVFLDPSGRIVRFNSACERLTGYTADELKGRDLWDALVPLIERSAVRTSFLRMVAERRPCECENHWITKTGESRHISWSNTVLQSNDGTVEYVIGTGVDVTDRLRLEREIVEVSEEERRRIGHELHERLCNHLAGTALIAESLAGEVRRGSEVNLNGLDQVTRLVSEAVEQARLLARGLVPVTIEEEGLVAALQEMVADVDAMTDIECTFEAGEHLPELAHTSMANHLYRIGQEAVDNAALHAHPRHIVVRLERTGDSLVLTIKDDGIGISTEPPATGLGLHMMRYRSRLIGGTITMEPHPQGGTEVRCVVPAPRVPSRWNLNGALVK